MHEKQKNLECQQGGQWTTCAAIYIMLHLIHVNIVNVRVRVVY